MPCGHYPCKKRSKTTRFVHRCSQTNDQLIFHGTPPPPPPPRPSQWLGSLQSGQPSRVTWLLVGQTAPPIWMSWRKLRHFWSVVKQNPPHIPSYKRLPCVLLLFMRFLERGRVSQLSPLLSFSYTCKRVSGGVVSTTNPPQKAEPVNWWPCVCLIDFTHFYVPDWILSVYILLIRSSHQE